MKLFIKGLIIGIGKILPGVSGGLLAIMMNVYDEAIDKLIHPFNRESMKYLFLLGSGILISILFGSKLILNLLNKYYLMIMLLFIGLIIGGSLELKNKVKKIKPLITMSGISILFIVYLFKTHHNKITAIGLFLVGIIEAGTIVIPGVSGTAILMVLGYYHQIMSLISELTVIENFMTSFITLIPFFIGLGIGLIIFINLMHYLMNKYHNLLYNFIIGISFGSIILLFLETFRLRYQIHEIILGIFLFFIGYKVSKQFI